MDVREAAWRTLGAGSARVRMMPEFVAQPPKHEWFAFFLMPVEGVADLARHRARLKTTGGAEMDALLERIRSKWPWLDDDDDDGGESMESLVIDGRRYIQGPDGGWALADHGSQLDNPAWIVRALAAGAGGATSIGSEEVRGEACQRYTLEPVDLRAAVRASNGELELPPHGHVERPTLRADVWIGGDGLIRRAKWSQPPRGRPRRPRERPFVTGTTVELWDFGLPVTIDVPKVGPPPDYGRALPALWGLGVELWRRRRAYHSTGT